MQEPRTSADSRRTGLEAVRQNARCRVSLPAQTPDAPVRTRVVGDARAWIPASVWPCANSTSRWAISPATPTVCGQGWRPRATAAPTSSSSPELSITGYPPEDLLLKPSFVRDAGRALDRVAAAVTGIVAVVGAPVGKAPSPAADAPAPLALYNGAAVLADGETAATYRKHHLPNYAVFDERRYFAPGGQAVVIDLGGVRLGVSVCEDIWAPGGPAERAALDGGAEVLVNLSASPYHRAKGEERERLFAAPLRRAPLLSRLLQCCRRAGRAGLRPDTASSSGRTARCGRAGRSSRKTSWSSTSMSGGARACGTGTRGGRGRRSAPVRPPAKGGSRRRDPLRPPAPRHLRVGARARSPWSASAGSAPARLPPFPRRDRRRSCRPRRRRTARSRSELQTTCARTGSPAPCSACRAASTPRSRSRLRPTRSARMR